MEKRYQYRGPNGKEWTKWFKIPDNSVKEKHQDKGLKTNTEMVKTIITDHLLSYIIPAHETLKKETHCKAMHAWDNAGWYGDGTIELSMLPPSKESYYKHKDSWDKFFKAIKDSPYAYGDEFETYSRVEKKGRRFIVNIKLQNLPYEK